PKNPRRLGFGINDVARQMFWEAKSGSHWIMIKGIFRYRDIFYQKWDNIFCFIYNPSKYKKSGFTGCPKYDDEQPAKDAFVIQPPSLSLPEVPKTNLE